MVMPPGIFVAVTRDCRSGSICILVAPVLQQLFRYLRVESCQLGCTAAADLRCARGSPDRREPLSTALLGKALFFSEERMVLMVV